MKKMMKKVGLVGVVKHMVKVLVRKMVVALQDKLVLALIGAVVVGVSFFPMVRVVLGFLLKYFV